MVAIADSLSAVVFFVIENTLYNSDLKIKRRVE